MHDGEHQIPIWFFIGGILLTYGVLIAASGVYNYLSPPPLEQRVQLWHLHADIWWGIFMAAVGLLYTLKYRPDRAAAKPGIEGLE